MTYTPTPEDVERAAKVLCCRGPCACDALNTSCRCYALVRWGDEAKMLLRDHHLALAERGVFVAEWQPIETAPKNADVLVFMPDAAQAMSIEIAHCSADNPDGDWYAGTHDGFPLDIPPTRWMPLPPEPKP